MYTKYRYKKYTYTKYILGGEKMTNMYDGLDVAKLIKEVMVLFKQNMSKTFGDIGITGPQGMVIGLLCKNGKMMISELSNNLTLSNSTVSGIIDRLEKQGIVIRERSEEDKRVVYVSLTSKFEEMHQQFHQRAEKNIENIMKNGTTEELSKIVEGLNTLKKLLSN